MFSITPRARRAALLAPLAAVLLLLVASSAGATGSYGDPAGDGGTAADVTKVTVGSDRAGTIQFDVSYGAPATGAEPLTFLFLDTDMTSTTGDVDFDGAEYAFAHDPTDHAYEFMRWNGADWEVSPSDSTVRVFSVPTGLRIVVNRSDLGNTAGFNFWVGTMAGEPDARQRDSAPDQGTWNYTLAAGGPDIRGVLVTRVPLAPRAGRPFTVTPTELQLPATGTSAGLAPKPDSYSCRATLGVKAIAGSGVGGCTWTLPKTARKRMLAVVVTVNYQGATKSVPFAYRVT